MKHIRSMKDSTCMASIVFTILGIALLMALLGGCTQQVAGDGNSTFNAQSGLTVPFDAAIYHLRGEVVGEVDSLSRQTSGGSLTLSSYPYISGSGSFYSETSGKGFVRLRVLTITSSIIPARSDLAAALGAPGDTILVKTTDAKVQALHPGDVVSFVCRADFEQVGAATAGENLTQQGVYDLGTWEFDLCRMRVPIVGEGE